ncbi:IS605 OrfB family transposase [Nocardia goodfellowii]|uniref:IS605 OrfB family transposase n=2 Tax=Nocardia goodfellowii TaxID=882446 RepID=A0ABS4QQG3_9NOCA|nr:IS605 OrfB family transposase [Nocardia goodfellowii]
MESTRKLARHIERGTARIRSATVSFRRGRWYVSFSVEVDHHIPAPTRHRLPVVGVDLGITHLAVLSQPVAGLSDEQGMVPNPRRLEHAQRKLRRLQRQAARRRAPDKRTRETPSRRWSVTRAEIARLHTRVASSRADMLHKLTTGLVASFAAIVVEDLHVAGLLRNRRLSRQIAGVGWGELRRQLEYKAAWSGTQLLVADRFYASSKTCSSCGAVKAKLRLCERVYRCGQCPLVLDRDLNAAQNLAGLTVPTDGTSTASCAATENEPAGNPRKTGTESATGIATGRPPRSTLGSDTAAAEQATVRSPLRSFS